MPLPEDGSPTDWSRIRAALRHAVPEATWHLWLEPVALRSLAAGTLVLAAPAARRAWVAGRYGRVVQACAGAVLGEDVVVEWVDAETEPSPPPAAVPGGAGDPHAAAAFNPRLTFEQFVIGDGNRLAHAAALAVAELPGLAYNPLFICGAPGLGKTHLLHSIAQYVAAHASGLVVRHTTAEAFTDAYVGAVQGGGMDAFRAAHRGVDVLLVDDVQFLQRKQRTEEEFFHTFNALLAAGAQVVLTSDVPPRDLSGMEDRLRERFEAGLVTDVRAPDLVTRRTILRKRVLQDGLEGSVGAEALDLIAERVSASVRALEGALIRVVAFASLTGRPVDPALAGEVLDGLYPDLRPRARTVEEIQQATCEAFGVALDDLLSASRAAPVAWPRQVAMYLARELTDQSLPAIGSAFGGRSHTTILHAWRRTAARLKDDAEAFDAVQALSRRLGHGDDDRRS